MPRPEKPAPDTVLADDDWPADLDSAATARSPESPLFLDEPDAAASSFFVQATSPVLHSGPAGIIGPTVYREQRDRLAVRAARHTVNAAVAAGQRTVHALRRIIYFIADAARRLFQQVRAYAQTRARRLSVRSGMASVSLRSGLRGRGTVADAVLAMLALAALGYVARPAPSASRDVSAEAPRVDVAVPVSKPMTSASVAAVSLGATAPPASKASVGHRAPENSSVRVPAATRSRGGSAPPAAARRVATEPSFVGALRVTSQPAGAEVSLNGVPQGRTPLTINHVRAGNRVVSLSFPGYERWSWSVAVVADTQTALAVKLQADHRRSGSHPE